MAFLFSSFLLLLCLLTHFLLNNYLSYIPLNLILNDIFYILQIKSMISSFHHSLPIFPPSTSPFFFIPSPSLSTSTIPQSPCIFIQLYSMINLSVLNSVTWTDSITSAIFVYLCTRPVLPLPFVFHLGLVNTERSSSSLFSLFASFLQVQS